MIRYRRQNRPAWTIDPSLPMEVNGRRVVRVAVDLSDETVQVRTPGRNGITEWYYLTDGRAHRLNRNGLILRNTIPLEQENNTVTTTATPAEPQPATMIAAVTDLTKKGTYGPFTVERGRVKQGTGVIFQLFRDTIGLIAVRGRASIVTVEGNELFDKFLADVAAAKIKVQYVSSIADFLDPKKRFEEFLSANTVPAGVELTAEELQVPALLSAIKAKFVEAFTPPVPAYVRSTEPLADSLKLVVRGSRISRGGSYALTITTARKLWNEAKKLWLANPETNTNRLGNGSYIRAGGGNTPTIYGDRIIIGCQTIRRNQVEEVAERLGWM